MVHPVSSLSEKGKEVAWGYLSFSLFSTVVDEIGLGVWVHHTVIINNMFIYQILTTKISD